MRGGLWGFVFFLITGVHADPLSGPSGFEKKIHEIYKKSYSSSLSEDEWLSQVKKLGQNTYQVQPGDTLWGLSQVFFGDGFFWPKIWSYNERITNPHEIGAGTQIQLFTGSIFRPPGAQLHMDESPEVSQLTLLKSRPSEESIPAFSLRIKPVLQQIPSLFQDHSKRFNKDQFNQWGLSVDIKPPVPIYPTLKPTSFLLKNLEAVPRQGEVVGSEGSGDMVSSNQFFYFNSENSYTPGTSITVMGREFNLTQMGVSGEVISYKGKAEVTDVLGQDLFRAQMGEVLKGVVKGDFINQEGLRAYADDLNGTPGQAQVELVGGALSPSQSIFYKGNIVFIKGGSEQGLKEGDILGIYKKKVSGTLDFQLDLSPRPVGHLKVFNVQEDVASAFVVASSQVISLGDQTGSPILGLGMDLDIGPDMDPDSDSNE